MTKFLLSSLKKAINVYLNLDAESKYKLRKFKGDAITIELLPFHFIFQLMFDEEGIQLFNEEIIPAKTKITGTPLQMLGVVIAKENRQRYFADDLKIEGDAELGLDVINLFDNIHIDWEEYLSRVVGDIPAYQTGRLIRGFSQSLKTIHRSLLENVSDYLHEEAALFPSPLALNDFFTEIDKLCMDVDRMQARIKQVEASLTIEHEDKL